jgi:hypothetical protein
MEIASLTRDFPGGRSAPTLRVRYLGRAGGGFYSCSISPFSASSQSASSPKNWRSISRSSGSERPVGWVPSSIESIHVEAAIMARSGFASPFFGGITELLHCDSVRESQNAVSGFLRKFVTLGGPLLHSWRPESRLSKRSAFPGGHSGDCATSGRPLLCNQGN